MNLLPKNYIEIIGKLKLQIKQSRIKAALKANQVVLELYWEIGLTIFQMQKEEGWGTKVIERISTDLKADFPDFKGLSVRNLKYMVLFAKTFPEFGQQAAALLKNDEIQELKFGQQLAAQLPWGHIQVLLDKNFESKKLNFYAQKCVDNGWSRNILAEQINTDLYRRQGNAITNFTQTLPSEISELAKETLKNPYLFDFLSLGEEAKERDLETALTKHLKQFMLELGRGFAYVGRQKNLVVEGDDFFLDLLFFNYNLNCFVVFELKVGDFKPEFAGKLNFYVNTVNEQLKSNMHKHTIGVLLCKTPNETVVKYSLQGIESPIGVAEYQLSEALPRQLKGELPSIEELENEIDKSYEELKSPQQNKLSLLKKKLNGIINKPLEQEFTMEAWISIFDNSLIPLFKTILIQLEDYRDLFLNQDYFWNGNNNITDIDKVKDAWKDEKFIRGRVLYFQYNFRAFKPSGTDAWDDLVQLSVHLEPYRYSFSTIGSIDPIYKKLYTEQLSSEDIEMITEKMCEYLNNRIEKYIESKENNP